MSGHHRRGHAALPSGSTVQALGMGAVASSVLLLVLAAAFSVLGAVQSSAAPAGRPVAATASPTDGPVTQPRDATAQPTPTPSATSAAPAATKAAKPSTLVKTGASSGALVSGALVALVAGVVLLVVGRDLPLGRHERTARHLAT
jgi:Na+-transporting methylmalonyl-CoA/oxaloacetate decarboxylase gamma subunit